MRATHTMSVPPSLLGRAATGSALLAAILLALCCLRGGASIQGADRSAGENQIKAAFLSNFAKFISWDGAKHTGDTFTIAVLADASFAEELRVVVRGHSIGGRAIHVRLLHLLADAGPMDVLFIPEGMEDHARPELPRLSRQGVLTVGESARHAAMGGVINFLMQSGKIKFSINRRAAEAAGLKISPQLLKLAVIEGGTAR